MTTLRALLQDFHQNLPLVDNQLAGEVLFESLLLEAGFRFAELSEYEELKEPLLNPLNLSYPKASRSEKWFVRRAFDGGSNFLINLGGHVFPLELRVTHSRRNPSWGGRIVPSIGACVSAELETNDSTIFLCGTFSHRSEKVALWNLNSDHEIFREKIKLQEGIQIPHASLIYLQGPKDELLYQCASRAIREQEAHRLIAHFESPSQ